MNLNVKSYGTMTTIINAGRVIGENAEWSTMSCVTGMVLIEAKRANFVYLAI